MRNKYIPGLVKIGKSQSALLRTETLETEKKGPTGVPGLFEVEYARETLLSIKYGNIETHIQNHLRNKLVEEGYLDKEILQIWEIEYELKEFFIVPSVKYAILAVEEELDKFEKYLAIIDFRNFKERKMA